MYSMSPEKTLILQAILEKLKADHSLLLQAAQASHAAATDAENIPDNKYETLALEASYIAQGQANRAAEIRRALESYRQLRLLDFGADAPIRLTALVELEDDEGRRQRVFLGPAAGGLKLATAGTELMVITPESPLGRELIGLRCGDAFEFSSGGRVKEYEILSVR